MIKNKSMKHLRMCIWWLGQFCMWKTFATVISTYDFKTCWIQECCAYFLFLLSKIFWQKLIMLHLSSQPSCALVLIYLLHVQNLCSPISSLETSYLKPLYNYIIQQRHLLNLIYCCFNTITGIVSWFSSFPLR